MANIKISKDRLKELMQSHINECKMEESKTVKENEDCEELDENSVAAIAGMNLPLGASRPKIKKEANIPPTSKPSKSMKPKSSYFEKFNKDLNKHSIKEAVAPRQKLVYRPLYEIAEDIRRDWRNVYFGARPYLSAMSGLDSMGGKYGADEARSIVAYFLSNAAQWKGETAKAIKKELNYMLKHPEAGETQPSQKPSLRASLSQNKTTMTESEKLIEEMMAEPEVVDDGVKIQISEAALAMLKKKYGANYTKVLQESLNTLVPEEAVEEALSAPDAFHAQKSNPDEKRVGNKSNSMWKQKLQNLYGSLDEFGYYDQSYNLAQRLGFDSAEEAWNANPTIQGSVYPEDFSVAKDETVTEAFGASEQSGQNPSAIIKKVLADKGIQYKSVKSQTLNFEGIPKKTVTLKLLQSITEEQHNELKQLAKANGFVLTIYASNGISG